MTEKPTYEELEKRIQEFEQTESNRKRIEEQLSHSRDLMSYVISNAQCAIAIHDRDLKYIYVSKRYLKDYKVKETNVIGKHHYEVFPDLPQKWRDVHQRSLAGEVVNAEEDPYYREDGSVDWTRWECRPWYESDGSIGGIIIYTEVINDHKQAEETLRVSEQKLATHLQNTPLGALSWDLNFKAIEWNPAAEAIFGYSKAEAMGKHVTELILPEELKEMADDIFKDLIFGKGGNHSINENITKDGRQIICDWYNTTLKDDNGKVISVVSLVQDITERKQTEESLRTSHKRFLTVLNSIDATIYVADMETYEILFMNKPMIESFGRDLTGEICWKAFRQESEPCSFCTNDQLIDENKKTTGVHTWQGKNPVTGKWYINYDRAIEWTDGRLVRLQIATDITEFKNLESKFQQAQKMESVGRLAGGVAHDFNNALSVIKGFTEMALDDTDPKVQLHEDLNEIYMAANRAADITRQLLAFARKQTISPKMLDLNENVESMLKMIRRLIGEDIDLAWLPGANLWSVKVDPTQIDQIMANLCVNARDAIEGVGKVTIESENVTLTNDYCMDHTGFVPGEFVKLSVSDNGCGMNKEILNNIFEPFFTTKDVGKGTGLGLATVYGIIKQNNGFINVYSEPDIGTTINIYLPMHEIKAVKNHKESIEEIPISKGETVLVVEDDPSILNIMQKILEKLNYKVLTSSAPEKTMDIVKEYTSKIHLLITDVIMPKMNGRDLAEQLQSDYPDLKCIFMSGYTADAIVNQKILEEKINFIQKPFSRIDLAKIVRKVLDEN